LKKVFIIFLLLPFLYLNIGFYPFFIIKQQLIKLEIKQKIKNNLPPNELIEIVFTKADYNSLTWKEKNEFSYHNHMYDIVKSETDKNNNIHLFCIDDKKEKSLFTQLDKLTSTSEKSKQNKEFFLTKTLFKDYLPQKVLTFEQFYKTVFHSVLQNEIYFSFIPDKPSPPPKIC
jgi:hypothetical protein